MLRWPIFRRRRALYAVVTPKGGPPPTLSKVTSGKVFLENFDDNYLDTALWSTGASGTGPKSIDEINQRLEIALQAALAAWEDAYIVSTGTYAFTTKRVYQIFMSIPSIASPGRAVEFLLAPTRTTTGRPIAEPNNIRFMIWRSAAAWGYYLTKMVGGVATTIKSEIDITDWDIRVLLVLDPTNVEVYVEGTQWLAPTAHGLAFDTPYIYLNNATNNDTESITTIHDDCAVFKDTIVKVTDLKAGQKVELYDATDTLVDSAVVATGATEVSLSILTKTIPFDGYFKVYKTDGVTLWYRYPETGTVEIWGGDAYQQV